MNKKMSVGKIVGLCFIGILFIIVIACASKLVETVEKGTYQIKQAAISGTMSAKMTPGIWMQMFGDIDEWPKAETYFFTHDNDTKGDVDLDTSIEVRFNDGSMCKISGTLRIIMPTTPDEAISLVINRGHKTYRDVQEKLIKPTVRNVLRSTANLMTARESYSERRLDFITWARDQITNGVYKTREERAEVEDLVTGEKINKMIKVIQTKDGSPLYESNPMSGTGIELKNFEIKSFVYEKKVQAQIAKQQEARMAVETAKARAEQAKQLTQQTIAEGKQKVAAAKYAKEQDKVRAVVEAQKNKEVQELDAARDKNVAVIAGEKRKDVAALDRDAAKLKKEEQILLGQGEAERKKLVLAADGALAQKLDALRYIHKKYAEAYSQRKVPSVYMAGGAEDGKGGPDNEFTQFMNMMNIGIAKQLSVDTTIPAGAQTK
jgi:regulator of protease activity HflC (stomatin/prohibitin superfamily)